MGYRTGSGQRAAAPAPGAWGQSLERLRGGRLRMTLRVADTRELVGWILSFSRGARVVRPAALRGQVREGAQAGVTSSVTRDWQAGVSC